MSIVTIAIELKAVRVDPTKNMLPMQMWSIVLQHRLQCTKNGITLRHKKILLQFIMFFSQTIKRIGFVAFAGLTQFRGFIRFLMASIAN